MNNSFKRNLLVSYGTSLFLLIVSSIASFISIRNLLESQEWVNHTNLVINKLENVISVLKDGETGERGFLLTGEPEFLDPYNGASEKANRLIEEVKALTADNLSQQQSIEQIREISNKRLTHFQHLIENKKAGISPTLEDLRLGKTQMDECRKLVQQMQSREHALLNSRTGTVSRFVSYTSLLILLASLLAVLVTIISFIRVNNDFNKRVELQLALQRKDEETTQRLNIIRDIADKISLGNYQTRVSDEGKDVLGALSMSLNKMAESLDYSFTSLSEKEWLQAGVAGLNEKMIGEKDLGLLTSHVLEYLADYTESAVGAFYLVEDQHVLSLSATIGLNITQVPKEILLGEGLAGRSGLTGKTIQLQDITGAEIMINYSAGSIKPNSIIALPVYHEGILKGVIEIASLKPYSEVAVEFLKAALFNTGIAVNSAQDHRRLQALLEETQAQSEELQSQHNELEHINAELEAQSQRLQASEEELRVQQEELQEANQELESRSRLLQEGNDLILERNFEIQAKAEELAQSTRYKSEFLANMSHELRTPLNSILLLSRLLSENHPANLLKEQVEYAEVIQSSGNGLLSLIDEILDLSKIESGKIELEYGYVALEEIQDEMKALFGPLAADKGIAFMLETGAGLPKMIETDQLRLQQILRNLVSNALKFTANGQVTLEIKKELPAISFAVKDTGIGIAKDKLQTIFEAFQQADGSTRRKYGGTGLGLSISRELARLLGGDIYLESEEGKGSVFTLKIPLHKESIVKATTVADLEKRPDPVKEEKYIATYIPASIPDDRNLVSDGDKVILIIEDDTAFARSLLEYTRQNGFKGIVAVRGDEGVELAKQHLPLGILLDIELPVKSGWEVMEELKTDPATRPIPVHIMSSHEVKHRSLSRGAVDFINKPIAFEKLSEIFQKIEHALSKHPKKVLIIEENKKHAQGLAYFLESFNISTEIKNTVGEGLNALNRAEVDCVILDMGIPTQGSYDILEEVKKTPGYENLPIIIFTGKNLSHTEEFRIKQYADSIVVKTAHSYQRILDEVSLFLHLVEQNKKDPGSYYYRKMNDLSQVLKGKTVLVADDDVRNIFSLTKSLEAHGLKVLSAIDGKEALTLLAEGTKVDLILMDMMMPEMDGYESTARIREIPAYKTLPIIAVTAKAMTGDREKCINAGASDYITKPVDVDQLISLLRVWLYE